MYALAVPMLPLDELCIGQASVLLAKSPDKLFIDASVPGAGHVWVQILSVLDRGQGLTVATPT